LEGRALVARVVASGFERRLSSFAEAKRIRDASRRRPASGRDPKSVLQRIMPEQKLVQQHSGDWTMTGKVPVARAEGHQP